MSAEWTTGPSNSPQFSPVDEFMMADHHLSASPPFGNLSSESPPVGATMTGTHGETAVIRAPELSWRMWIVLPVLTPGFCQQWVYNQGHAAMVRPRSSRQEAPLRTLPTGGYPLAGVPKCPDPLLPRLNPLLA